MYYAKARLYDTADKHGSTKGNKLGDKRFMAVDPVKGDTHNPQSMVQYIYTLNDPMMYVDPLGKLTIGVGLSGEGHIAAVGADFTAMIVLGDDGVVALVVSESFGGSGGDIISLTKLDVGISGVAGITDAYSAWDLYRTSGTVSGAAGPISTGQGQPVKGITVGKGKSTVLVELHGKVTQTQIIEIVNLRDTAEANLDDAIYSELGMTREQFYDQLACDYLRAQEAAEKYHWGNK